MDPDSNLGRPRAQPRREEDHNDQLVPPPTPALAQSTVAGMDSTGYPFAPHQHQLHHPHQLQHQPVPPHHYLPISPNRPGLPHHHPSGHPANPVPVQQVQQYQPYYPPAPGYPPPNPNTNTNTNTSNPASQQQPSSTQLIPAPAPPPPIHQQHGPAYNHPSQIFSQNQLYNYHHPSNINYPNSPQQAHPHSQLHLQHHPHPHPHPHPIYPHPHLVHPSPNISPSHVSSPSTHHQFSAYSPHIRSPSSSDHPTHPFSPFQNSPPPIPHSPFEPSYQHMAIPYEPNQDHPGPAPTTPAHYPQHQLFSPFTSPNPNYDSHPPRPPGYQPHSPLHSPFASPRQNPSRQMRTPARQPHSPRYGPFAQKSPYSSGSSPSTQGPRSPSSLVMAESLVRGSLAQAKLRSHVFKREHLPIGSLSIVKPKTATGGQSQGLHLDRPALPRPPSHSEHALWVGNVPNDATHEELWKFFAERPGRAGEREGGAGVESIHLIGRSNCAFVNYISEDHLAEAIGTCNGRPLRPRDPHCKPLVCRVRKPEDNVKSGVGAQRVGGMHRAWVRRGGAAGRRGGSAGGAGGERERGGKADHPWPVPTPSSTTPGPHPRQLQVPPPQPQPAAAPTAESTGVVPTTTVTAGEEDQSKRTTSTTSTSNNSNQSLSTTSSFLTRYFPKRYFILKSYTEEDLHLSVTRSIWASQSHNEPVLDQAYRTSPSGVFLIFSVNRSGEFYGYARMAGPIWSNSTKKKRRVSEPAGSQELLERQDEEQQGEGGRTRRASVGTSGKELVGFGGGVRTASPPPISPVGETRWPGESGQHRSLPLATFRKPAEALENSAPSPSRVSESPVVDTVTREGDEQDDENPEEDEDDEQQRLMSGRPFKVEWMRVQKLAFYKTRELRNPFNGNREVKVSRDGTEVEPSIGEAIVELIEREWEVFHQQGQGVKGQGHQAPGQEQQQQHQGHQQQLPGHQQQWQGQQQPWQGQQQAPQQAQHQGQGQGQGGKNKKIGLGVSPTAGGVGTGWGASGVSGGAGAGKRGGS